MPKNISKNSFKPLLAACAVLSTATLPALAAPQTTTPPTTNRTPAASTPAAAKPVPSVAIKDVTIAAEVGDEKIMMADVNDMIDDIIQTNPELQADTPANKAQIKQLREDLVNNMIAQRLMFQEAVRRDKVQTDKTKLLLPTEEQTSAAVWSFQKSFASEVGFKRWLEDSKKTEADLRTLFKRRIAIENFKTSLISEVTVTDADVKAFYETHKNDPEMTVPDTVNARHIQISFPTERDKEGKLVVKTMTADERKKLLQKAQSVLKKAQAEGTDFAVLAASSSDDLDSKTNGGDLGTLTRGDVLDDEFATALFSAPVGKVSPKLVETKVGFHIIKIDDKKLGRTMAMTEVSAAIKPRILAEKAKAKVDQQVASLMKTTKVTKNF